MKNILICLVLRLATGSPLIKFQRVMVFLFGYELIFDRRTINHVLCAGLIFKIQDFKVHFFYLVTVFLNSEELTGFNIFKDLHSSAGGPFYDQFINHGCFTDPDFFSDRRTSKAAPGIYVPVNRSFLAGFRKINGYMCPDG